MAGCSCSSSNAPGSSEHCKGATHSIPPRLPRQGQIAIRDISLVFRHCRRRSVLIPTGASFLFRAVRVRQSKYSPD
jgi:hypothetical protein